MARRFCSQPIYNALLIVLVLTLLLLQGLSIQSNAAQLRIGSQPKPANGDENLRKVQNRTSGRRMMIGSTMPTCTYNECRGCKHKCRAEQIPVDGNDPINSAYHYKCVCHRY